MHSIARMVLGLASAGALVALAGGCTSIRDHRGYLADAALLDSVQVGVDNQLSVERTLGRPTFVAQYGKPAWYYVAVNTKQAAFTRPQTDNQTVVRIRFNAAGNVASIDRAGADKVVRLDPDSHKTPTLGRDRGLLEDLFGNIGTVGAPGGGGGPGGAPKGSGPNGS